MKLKKLVGLIQILCLMFLCISFLKFDIVAASSVGLGDVSFTETRTIYDGVSLEYAIGYNNNEDQKAYTVEMDKGALVPYATYGQYVYGGEKLTSMIAKAEADTGRKVVLAINGDFYDTSNGVPLGIMIVDGKVVTLGTTAGSEAALGFKADGTVVFGNPQFSLSYNDGSSDVSVRYLNNDRKLDTSNLYLYTGDFGTSTKSIVNGTEVLLQVEADLFKLDETVTAKVISRGTKDTPLANNTIVIASGVENDPRLASLTVDKEITVCLKDNNPSFGWKEVVQSIGYPHLLAVNGAPTSTTINDPAVHPRTALGIKEDGSVVLFQVDGRQPGWSNGLSFKQMVEWMCDVKGCKTVVNLDGGGSSTIIARLPGNESGTILNSPSDNVERSNSNGILFFAPDEADTTKALEYIHSYPNHLIILENGETNIEIKATDKYYYPVDTPTDITYEIVGGVGTIENGVFKAATGAKTGKIVVSALGKQTECIVEVVDSVSKITADKTIISIAPNDKIELQLTAYYNGMPIVCSNSSFNWRLSSSTIGTISDGVFTGSSAGGTGSVTVSYKSFELTIPVEVGKQPMMISTFENVTIGSNWLQTIEGSGGGKGTVSINEDERYVKFGKKSLRVDYDFRSATATTSVTAYQNGGYYKVDGYPTNIGVWVYGDGNGANVRIQMRDGNGSVQYISFNPDVVSWTGWKYIECDIPSGLPTPIQIQYPIRVMSVGGKVKTSGTLYFDNLRAVYGFRNDDVLEPSVKDITPADGSVVSDKQQRIGLTVWDQPDVNSVFTGINKDSLEFTLNDEKLTNVVLLDNADGSISINYTPSALSLLKSGPQIVKVRIEDNYGNITIRQWQFLVEGEYAGVDGIVPEENIVYAGDTIYYKITANTFTNFEKVTGTMLFNNAALRLKRVTVEDGSLKTSNDSTSSANTNGKWNFSLEGMNLSTYPEDGVLVTLAFSPVNGFTGGAGTEIFFDNVFVYETGYSTPTKFLLPSYEKIVDYRYRISYVTSTCGYPITFKVTDENLNPVAGVEFVVGGGVNLQLFTRTDSEGYVTFDEFKNLAVDTTFTITASKGSNYSETITMKMHDSLGTSSPSSIVVSPGYNPSESVYITWQTKLSTTGTIINYRKVGETTWQTETINNYTKQIYVVNGTVTQEYLSHIVEIDGLSANTKYEYTVGDGVTTSSVRQFSTLPTDDIEMLFFGDPQNTSVAGYNITKSVMAAGLTTQPNTSLVLYAGDVVDNVTMYSQWQAFDTVMGEYNSSIITAAATGNHDVITGYAEPFIYSLTPMQNGCETIGANYYFEAGDAVIAVIDTETPTMYDAQAEWLNNVMLSSSKKFRIVLMHRSTYAANYDEPHIRNYWPEVFENAKVDLVLSGHDHVYNSTTMLEGKKTTTDKGVTYVVGGTSGQKYYASNNLESRYWLDFVYDDDYPIYSTIAIKNGVLTFVSYALVNGASTKINEIVINAKTVDVDKVVVGELSEIASSIRPFDLSGTAYDSSNKVISNTLGWSIKENIAGLAIVGGKLVVSADYSGPSEVTLLATCFGKTEEVTVKIQKVYSLDVLENGLELYQQLLSDIFN